MAQSADSLRRQAVRARQALSASDHARASAAACHRLRQLAVCRQARHIALYMPCASELDCSYLIPSLSHGDKALYFPLLGPSPRRRLHFILSGPDTRWVLNRHGIAEPLPRSASDDINPRWLDLIVTPLTAFDTQCHRLGAGGGWYDRTLGFTRYQHYPRPTLIGLAFDSQRVDSITPQSWDVAMDAIVTESGIISRHPEFTHA